MTHVRNIYALEQFSRENAYKLLLIRHSASGFKFNEVTSKCHVFMVDLKYRYICIYCSRHQVQVNSFK